MTAMFIEGITLPFTPGPSLIEKIRIADKIPSTYPLNRDLLEIFHWTPRERDPTMCVFSLLWSNEPKRWENGFYITAVNAKGVSLGAWRVLL